MYILPPKYSIALCDLLNPLHWMHTCKAFSHKLHFYWSKYLYHRSRCGVKEISFSWRESCPPLILILTISRGQFNSPWHERIWTLLCTSKPLGFWKRDFETFWSVIKRLDALTHSREKKAGNKIPSKSRVHPKLKKSSHHLLTLVTFQTHRIFFLLWKHKRRNFTKIVHHVW